jgi:uncharacterized protein YbjT (DUF2867 family)
VEAGTLIRHALVIGANGKTGRAVCAAMSARGVRARAFLRAPNQWPALAAQGIANDHAVGDLADRRTLDTAMVGMDAVVHIGPPMHPDEVLFARNAMDAALAAKLPHFVYYSVMHPLRRDVRHHRLKLDVEEQLVESGLPYTILQPTRYMQHLEPIWRTVIEQGVHAMPFNVDVKFNVADLRDHAAAAATVIAELEHHLYATYELAGPQALSQTDMAGIISHIIGRPVTARALSAEELRSRALAAGQSADRIEQMLAMNRHYDHHGFRGNPNVLRMLLGREPGLFADYVQELWSKR